MPTTVHIPPALLARIDRRATQLGISRNRYIVRALGSAVDDETRWSPAFLELLAKARSDAGAKEAVDEMMQHITSRRTSRAPIDL